MRELLAMLQPEARQRLLEQPPARLLEDLSGDLLGVAGDPCQVRVERASSARSHLTRCGQRGLRPNQRGQLALALSASAMQTNKLTTTIFGKKVYTSNLGPFTIKSLRTKIVICYTCLWLDYWMILVLCTKQISAMKKLT